MKLYIATLNTLNCEQILAEICNHEVKPSNGHMELDPTNPYYQEYIKQTQMLESAGYTSATVEYRHYQSGIHFNNNHENVIGELVGAVPLMCWVSEIRPGKCTPWHWDINPWEKEHKHLGQLVRYFCFLSKPEPGHVFVTEEDAYYNEDQGTIYQYADMHSWHAGSNIGIVPKFLLTFTGYKKF
jgi:hypothetical protein